MAEKSGGFSAIGDAIGGLLGIPGKVLGEAGGILSDSITPQGTISVSTLLNLGGKRDRIQKRRDLETKLSELQIQEAEEQIEMRRFENTAAKQNLSPVAAESIAGILGPQAGAKSAQVVGPAPGTLQRQEAIKAGAIGEAQFLKRNALDEAAQQQRLQARESLNAALKVAGVNSPEAITAQLPGDRVEALSLELAKGEIKLPIEARKKAEREAAATARFTQQAILQEQRLAATAVNARQRASEKVEKDIEGPFDISIHNDLDVALGLSRAIPATVGKEGLETGGRPRYERAPGVTAAQIQAHGEAKQFGQDVLRATGSRLAGRAAAVTMAMTQSGQPRFNLIPSFGDAKAKTKGFFSPTISKEGFNEAMVRVNEHRMRNKVLLDNGVKLADGTPMGLPVTTDAYIQEWVKAINMLPGFTASSVVDPVNGRFMLRIVAEDKEKEAKLGAALGGSIR